MGCDPSQGYFQKNITRLKQGTAKDRFQPREMIIKDGLSSSQIQCIEDR
jgi:hypothetical protein